MYVRPWYICLAAAFFLLFGMVQVSYGQEYATWTPNAGSLTPPGINLGGNGGVTNPQGAAMLSEETFATMTAARSLGLLGITIGKDAYLQLKFPTYKVNGATTYVKISNPTLTGVNLDLAQLLGLAGTNIVGEVWSGAGDAQDQRGQKIDIAVETAMIIDKDNNYYLAITPNGNVSYNSINIKFLYPDGLLSLGTFTMNVYHAFTLSGTPCSVNASFSNLGEAQGINLDLLGLSELIANPHHQGKRIKISL